MKQASDNANNKIASLLERAEALLLPNPAMAPIEGHPMSDDEINAYMKESLAIQRLIAGRQEIIGRLDLIKSSIEQGEFDSLILNVNAVIDLVKGE